MTHIKPRRLAAMLDNALVAAKQGNKPYPLVGIAEGDGMLQTFGIGQHLLVCDREHIESGGAAVTVVVIPSDEAEDAAKAIRQMPGAARKDTTVYATATGSVFTVASGDDTIVSLPSVDDDESGSFLSEFESACGLEAREPRKDFALYSNQILATLGKLKPNGEGGDRIMLEAAYAGDTTRFWTGSVWGFIEGNRTDPALLL